MALPNEDEFYERPKSIKEHIESLINTLRIMLEKSVEFRSPLHPLFIDF